MCYKIKPESEEEKAIHREARMMMNLVERDFPIIDALLKEMYLKGEQRGRKEARFSHKGDDDNFCCKSCLSKGRDEALEEAKMVIDVYYYKLAKQEIIDKLEALKKRGEKK